MYRSRILSCSTRAALLVLLSAVLGCSTGVSSANEGGVVPALARDSAGFIMRFGADTFAIERFKRDADGIEGELITRVPRLARTTYVATLGPTGSVSHMESVRYNSLAANASVVQRVTADVRNDTAHVQIVRGDSTTARKVAVTPGFIPYVSGTVVMDEIGAMRLWMESNVAPEGNVVYYPLGASKPETTSVRRAGADSVVMVTGEDSLRLRVDPSGRILSGLSIPTQAILMTMQRVSWNEAGRLATELSQRPGGGALGPLSPRDTVSASIAGASILVDYSRPSKRGRPIFGGLVPWDKVWRTGANEATTFFTDKDIVIGGTTVPAGSYTLYSLPSMSGWKLIINKNTGQWGTEYQAEHDLARISLTTEPLSPAVERFTIALEPRGSEGVIRLMWDTTQAWTPFRVRE